MPESARDRMYREAREAEQTQQQAAPQQVSMQPQPQPQQNIQPPPQQYPVLAPADKMRLEDPYRQYVLAEQVAGRQPKEMEQWAIDMRQGR